MDELFTFHEALERGMTASGLQRAVEAGRIRRIVHSVYADASLPDTPAVRAAALQRCCPNGVVLYLRSAAWVQGFDVLPPGTSIDDWPLQVVVPSDRTPPRVSGCKGYRAVLLDADVMEINGVLVTSPLRTALDCGRLLSRLDAQATVDQLVAADPDLQTRLYNCAEDYAGRRGVEQLRDVIALTDPLIESPGESWTRVLVVCAGQLPIPEPQIELLDHTGRAFVRLDNGYRDQQVGVEYDGREYHDGPDQVTHDEHRRTRVEHAGWWIAVARSHHIFHDGADLLIGIWNVMLQRGYQPVTDPPAEATLRRTCANLRHRWRGSEHIQHPHP